MGLACEGRGEGRGRAPPSRYSVPTASRPPRLSCPASCSCPHSPACSPPPGRRTSFTLHLLFPAITLPPVSPTCSARPHPALAFLDLGPAAPNLSATPSPPGRLPGGFPSPARLVRRLAPPTPLGARLPEPSGRSVLPSSPNSCTLPRPPFLPRPFCRCCLAFARSPALLAGLAHPPCPVRPSLLAAYPHAPPLPVLQPQASPAALLRGRFLLSLPGVEEELRHPQADRVSLPAAGAAHPSLFPPLPGKRGAERLGRNLAACWLSATNSGSGQ